MEKPFLANFFALNCEFQVTRGENEITFFDGYAQEIISSNSQGYKSENYEYKIKIIEPDLSNYNHKMCMLYVSGYETQDDKMLNEIVIGENVNQQVIFDENFKSVRFLYPESDPTKDLALYINVIDKAIYRVRVFINNREDKLLRDITVTRSQIYYIAGDELPIFCELDCLCNIIVQVDWTDTVAAMPKTNPMIEVTVRQILNTPSYLQKGIAKKDFTCGDRFYYLYTDIGKNEAGEVSVNFLRDFGNVWGKVVRKDQTSIDECAYQSTDHQNLDNKLSSILENKFNLSDLLSLNLDSILIKNKRRGITGLDNMGNTCYINSSIQCLSNTEDLTKYFLNEDFSKEINNGNTFGSKGVISNEYYKLINQLWNGSEQSITPKSFRLTFAKKEQAFYNNDQQDSQEFLLSLLNNLHEDLNRVTNKAYMEIKEQTKGESDESASKRFWDYNKSREDSIITDLFQGQYKSTIKCLNCENTSITYDNYLNLQLPIPSKKMQNQIKFLTYEGNCIDLNIKLEEKTELRNVIKNAILHLDNKK